MTRREFITLLGGAADRGARSTGRATACEGLRARLHRRVQDGRRRETLTAPAGKEV
jgi:hypothetical protein